MDGKAMAAWQHRSSRSRFSIPDSPAAKLRPYNAGMTAASDLERFIRDTIPMARAMDLRIAAHDAESLRLHAPLGPNINDKGCAFGGSLGGLMTMAGWALVTLTLRRHGIDADVFVANEETRFRTPLTRDLEAVARLAPESSWQAFLDMFAARGRAQVWIDAAVRGDGRDAATQHARFVALKRGTGSGT